MQWIEEQIRIAEEFLNILHDQEAIRMEAEEALQLVAFIPEKKAKHKQPKKGNTIYWKVNPNRNLSIMYGSTGVIAEILSYSYITLMCTIFVVYSYLICLGIITFMCYSFYTLIFIF